MGRHNRHQPVISRQSDEQFQENHWLKRFENSLLKDAVQPHQQSLFDQINTIMNGKSKYTSVEAAVQDMQERSGLTAYLNNLNKNSSTKKFANESNNQKDVKIDSLLDKSKAAIKTKNWYALGKYMGEIDMLNGNPRINGVESIRVMKYFYDPEISKTQIPIEDWETYTKGYGEGVHLSPDELEKDLKFTKQTIDHILRRKKIATDNTTPLIIQKHPAIMKTIENYIRDTKGNLPVPAIIDKIHAIHQTDVPDAKDWDDNKLIILVSKLNLAAKSTNPSNYENHSNLGSRDTGSDSEIDPSNTDAFHSLNPVKQ